MAYKATKTALPWAAIIKGFGVLASLLPMLTAFIKSLETPDVTGEDKKAGALAFLESLLHGGMAYTGEITEDVVQAVMSMAGMFIDSIVASYNAAKIFTHKA